MPFMRTELAHGILALSIFLASCESGGSRPTIHSWEETRVQARDFGVDYDQTLAHAERGDTRSIAELMQLSPRMDTAGSLGHAAVLLELVNVVGDRTFAEVLAAQSPATRRAVDHSLDVGVADATDAKLARPLNEQAPLTAAVLSSRQPS